VAPYEFGLAGEARAAGAAPGLVADPGPVIRAVAEEVRRGADRRTVAARFHAGVAALVVEVAARERESTGLDVVALGGGVFANSLLLASSVRGLEQRGFTVLRPRLLPPNDGGIALGQILVGSVS
jgi:hydrogenase maturation protein HypF